MTTNKSSLRLYRHPLSGHSHRVQLLLSLLRLSADLVDIDLAKREQKSPPFLAKNPFGTVPVLEDADVTIPDSNAIMVYLALKYDGSEQWYPRDPVIAARVQQWLSVAAGPLFQGPFAARAHKLFGAPFDLAKAKATADQLFLGFDKHLAQRDYFATAWPTIADLALYTYTAHAPEGGVSLEPYPNLRKWLYRIESLKGFVAMQRMPAKD
jgi:glutathione S-transferase